MEIRITREETHYLIRFAGLLDSVTIPPLENELMKIAKADHTVFVFDLESLDFIGSDGLRVFFRFWKATKPRDARILLCGVNKSIRAIFFHGGLANLFEFVDSRKEAIHSLTPKK
jgi:anti-anti-sigma factor